MADPHFMSLSDDSNEDLPRTFRREKAARAREARERAEQERASAPPSLDTPSEPQRPDSAFRPAGADFVAAANEPYGDAAPYADVAEMPYPASVRRFDVPFFHLMTFFIKAVFAAVPALIILGVMLWFGGHLLEAMFPELIKAKILITFPN